MPRRALVPALLLCLGCRPATDSSPNGETGSPDVTFEQIEDTPPVADLVVNEFMASNGGSLVLPDKSTPDWIEVYNADATEVDLGGYYLSDNSENPAKSRLPEGTVLEAGGFLLLYASGDTKLGPEHLDFGLSSKGEEIALTDRWGRRLDWVQFGLQDQDVAVGRAVDGDRDSEWLRLLVGTPGSTNNPGPTGTTP